MKKVLIATEKPFAKVAVDGISKIVKEGGYEVVLLENYKTKEELLQAVADVNALIIRSDIVDKEVLDAAKNLEIVVRAGAGFDNVDLKAATENKVVVMNTPGQNSNAVAELAVGMMLYAARNQFDGSSGTELLGKTLGIYGFGHIGSVLAHVAHALGMEVYAHAPSKSDEVLAAAGVKRAKSLEDLFHISQYVSVHVPKKPETVNSVNYTMLSTMPKGATLVNTARKEVIDEEALVKMFEERPDFKFVTDIMPAHAELLSEKYKKRLFATPKKMGAQTSEANINAGLAAANQIVGFFKTGDITFKVN